MATIISHPVSGYDPHSELKFYKALKKLSDDWKIIHSVAWLGSRGKRIGDGEADFVLLHREYGVVVVEVKGGRIDVKNGIWISKDHVGDVHEIKNPFEQATASKVNLHKYLTNKLGVPVSTCHAVAFPDITYSKQLGPAAPHDIVIDARSIHEIENAIARILKHWRQRASLSEHQLTKIVEAIAPTVTIKRTLADTAYDADAGLVQLTQDQIRAFAMTRRAPRAVVFGGAGTGKTILACEKARQLRDDGNKVLLTCFNSLLAQHLTNVDQSLDDIRISTFHSLCLSAAKEANIPVPRTPDENWWMVDAPVLLVDAAEQFKIHFDAIVVDEGQDFSEIWIEALESICPAGKDAIFYVFADEHQKLWDRDWIPQAHQHRLDLTTNCRNSKPISARVAAISESQSDCLEIDGPPTEWIDMSNMDEATQKVQRIVEKLIQEGIDKEHIVVLCETPSLASRLKEIAVADTGFCAYGKSGVVVETIGRFKGLESLAIVLVLDGVVPEPPDRNAYVGFSRARSLLKVLAPRSRKSVVHWR